MTIKNNNRPNPRIAMPKKKTFFSLVIVAGDIICFVVGNKGSAEVKIKNLMVGKGVCEANYINPYVAHVLHFLGTHIPRPSLKNVL